MNKALIISNVQRVEHETLRSYWFAITNVSGDQTVVQFKANIEPKDGDTLEVNGYSIKALSGIWETPASLYSQDGQVHQALILGKV